MKCEHCGSELVPIDIDIDGYYIKVWICNCNSDYDILNLTDDRVTEWVKQHDELGFDEREIWSLQTRISNYILPRLKLYREISVGRPGNVPTIEKWHNILDKMIKAFEISSLIFEHRSDPNYNINCEEGYNIYKEGMELFKEYFLDLWY